MKLVFNFNNQEIVLDKKMAEHLVDIQDVPFKFGDTSVWPTPLSTKKKNKDEVLGGLNHGDVSKALTKANFPKGASRVVVANSEGAIRSAGYRYGFSLSIDKINAAEYRVTRNR